MEVDRAEVVLAVRVVVSREVVELAHPVEQLRQAIGVEAGHAWCKQNSSAKDQPSFRLRILSALVSLSIFELLPLVIGCANRGRSGEFKARRIERVGTGRLRPRLRRAPQFCARWIRVDALAGTRCGPIDPTLPAGWCRSSFKGEIRCLPETHLEKFARIDVPCFATINIVGRVHANGRELDFSGLAVGHQSLRDIRIRQ